jgi:hypothetical protein
MPKKSRINSKQKGKRGELEFRDVLRSFGYSARRGQQFRGGEDSPDINCPELPFHFECKLVQRLNLRLAYNQARRDCGLSRPIVAHRENRGEWMVTMSARDFFEIVKYWPLLKPPDSPPVE